MKQRCESSLPPESPSTYVVGLESRLTSAHVDELLADQGTEAESREARGSAPIDGIWLGAAVGIILWTVIAGVVLLV